MAFPYTFDAESGVDFDAVNLAENNTLTQSSTKKNSGTYSYRFYWGTPSDNEVEAEIDIALATEVFCRVYINLDDYSIATGDYTNLITVRHTATCAAVSLRPTTGGFKIRYTVYENSGSTRVYDGSGADIGSTDGWVALEFHLKAGSGDGGGEIWLDGSSLASDFTLSNNTKIGTGVDLYVLGSLFGNAPTEGSICWWDDIKLADSYIGLLTTAYTITADYTAFALSGIANTLKKDSKISASVQSFTLTGISAFLLKGFKLFPSAGSFIFDGISVNLFKTFLLAASSGSFALTGFITNFTVTFIFILSADVAGFILTGNSVSLPISRNGPGYNPLICFKRKPHKMERHEPIERKDPGFSRRNRQCDD